MGYINKSKVKNKIKSKCSKLLCTLFLNSISFKAHVFSITRVEQVEQMPLTGNGMLIKIYLIKKTGHNLHFVVSF